MKILKKIVKLIIYLVSIISLIIIGGNIKYCSNQNKEKKETTHIKLSDRSTTLSDNPFSINELSVDTDLYHSNLIYTEYDYLLYNLDNGEVRLTNNLTSEGISNAYEPPIQYSRGFGMFQYLQYQYNIIKDRGHHLSDIGFSCQIYQPTMLQSDEYVSLDVELCLIGIDINNNLVNEPYFARFTNVSPFDYVYTSWGQIDNETFEEIYNLYVVFGIVQNGTENTSVRITINYQPINSITAYDYEYDDNLYNDIQNLYADFLLNDYNSYISQLETEVGQLEANNQGLYEENISLNNQIQVLDQEIERLEQEYNEAYNSGLADGQEQAFNIINFLERILLMLDSVLSVEILPYVRLWYIVAIPLVLGIVKMVLSWFR